MIYFFYIGDCYFGKVLVMYVKSGILGFCKNFVG